MADVSGSWALVSTENFDKYIEAIGVADDSREKALKLLQTTGDGGCVEKYEVDTVANTLKRSVYFDGKPFKEAAPIPLDKEFDGPALDDRIVKMKVITEGTNRLIRTEVGPSYTATIVSETNGPELTVTLTTGSGVISKRRYKRV